MPLWNGQLVTWKGKPLEAMTREELVDALSDAVKRLVEEREQHRRALEELLVLRKPS